MSDTHVDVAGDAALSPPSARATTSAAELDSLATHARQRLALYRRRVYVGRGEATKLAELERISAGAQDRARRARRSLGAPSAESASTSNETT